MKHGKKYQDSVKAFDLTKQYEAAEDKRIALLIFWVLKEAAAKCSGEGLRGFPDDTDFFLCDPRVTAREGCLVAAIEDRRNDYV